MKVEKELWEGRKRPKGVEVERRAVEYMTWEQEMGLWGIGRDQQEAEKGWGREVAGAKLHNERYQNVS